MQAIQTLSSAEAEFLAMVRGASIGLGAAAMAKNLELTVRQARSTDSSAALAVSGRRGVTKIVIW
eukprot:3926309-Amphidinium_carterae.1